MEFLKASSTLTLRAGLDELYREAPEVARVSKEKGKPFRDHDLTHVIFGCDTSIDGELLLKPWILHGTDINYDELREDATDPEVKRLNKEATALLGGHVKALALGVFYYLPLYFWVWIRYVRGMAKKWPHSRVSEAMLDTPLNELRQEYGIRLYPRGAG